MQLPKLSPVNLISDNITGFPTDEEKNLADHQKASTDLVQSLQVDKMMETEGWQILSSFMDNAIETHTGQLVYEKDPEKLRRLQALVQALTFLPRVIQQLKLDGEQAKQMLNSFVADPEYPANLEGR